MSNFPEHIQHPSEGRRFVEPSTITRSSAQEIRDFASQQSPETRPQTALETVLDVAELRRSQAQHILERLVGLVTRLRGEAKPEGNSGIAPSPSGLLGHIHGTLDDAASAQSASIGMLDILDALI